MIKKPYSHSIHSSFYVWGIHTYFAITVNWEVAVTLIAFWINDINDFILVHDRNFTFFNVLTLEGPRQGYARFIFHIGVDECGFGAEKPHLIKLLFLKFPEKRIKFTAVFLNLC